MSETQTNYESPSATLAAEAPEVKSTELNGFSKVFIIIDLIFSFFTLLGVIINIFAKNYLIESGIITESIAQLNIALGVGLFFTSAIGNTVLLSGKKWGSYLCYISLVFVGVITAIGFTHLDSSGSAFPMEGMQEMGNVMLLTAIGSAVVKVIYNGFYGFAVYKAAKQLS